MTTWLHLIALGLISVVSPTSLVPVIALIGSRNGPRAVAFYFAGSFCSITITTAIVAGGFLGADVGHSSTSLLKALFEIVVGLVSIVFAVRIWMRRGDAAQREKREKPPPRWVGFFDRLGLFGAFLFGVFWVNMVLAVDAGLEIATEEFHGPFDARAGHEA